MSSNQEEQDLDRKAQDLLNLREAVEKPNFQDALDNSEKFKNIGIGTGRAVKGMGAGLALAGIGSLIGSHRKKHPMSKNETIQELMRQTSDAA